MKGTQVFELLREISEMEKTMVKQVREWEEDAIWVGDFYIKRFPSSYEVMLKISRNGATIAKLRIYVPTWEIRERQIQDWIGYLLFLTEVIRTVGEVEVGTSTFFLNN